MKHAHTFTLFFLLSVLSAVTAQGQDLTVGSKIANSWILHAPNDTRQSLWISPGTNGTSWGFGQGLLMQKNGPITLQSAVVSVGGSRNAQMRVRHLEGKAPASDVYDNLYLQYLSKKNTVIGGNLGIGTQTPTRRLDVAGAGKFISTLLIEQDNQDTYLQFHDPGNMLFTMGIDVSDLRKFKINQGSLPGSTNQLVLQSDGKVGIGTPNPTHKLTVAGAGKFTTNLLVEQDNQDTYLQFHDPGNMLFAMGIDVSDLRKLKINQGSLPGSTNQLVLQSDGKVGIGTSKPTALLTVAGKIFARDIEVGVSAGADFVFEEDYPLRELGELEAYLKANKHLPEIAPAAQMQQEGMNVSKFTVQLLQKVEELTLYTIQQEKKIEMLMQKMDEQAKAIEDLKAKE